LKDGSEPEFGQDSILKMLKYNTTLAWAVAFLQCKVVISASQPVPSEGWSSMQFADGESILTKAVQEQNAEMVKVF